MHGCVFCGRLFKRKCDCSRHSKTCRFNPKSKRYIFQECVCKKCGKVYNLFNGASVNFCSVSCRNSHGECSAELKEKISKGVKNAVKKAREDGSHEEWIQRSLDKTGFKRRHPVYCLNCGKELDTNHTRKTQLCYNCWRTLDSHRKTQEEFIAQAIEIHGNKYDYSKSLYKALSDKIVISCPIHGEFAQRAGDHLKGHGCPKCAQSQRIISNEDYIKRAIEIYGDLYSYDKTNFSGTRKIITVTCPIHGDFDVQAGHFLYNKSGCPKCQRHSYGEFVIDNWLKENKIEFQREKTFPDLVYKRPLRYDFYIPDKNIVIEFNGRQHYEFVKEFHRTEDRFKEYQIKDNMKKDYASKHNFSYVEIPYWKLNDINDILSLSINKGF